MGKGRKPLPNAIKKTRGTSQPVRMRNEMTTEKIVQVKVHKALKSLRARKIFKEKSQQLINLNMLIELDVDQLAIYSNSLAMLFDCIEDIERNGKFILQETDKGSYYLPNPHLKLYREMTEIVTKIGSDFGFSPVSRMKFVTNRKETDPDDKDFN